MDRTTGAGLSALMEACLSVGTPNRTVGPIVLAAVIGIAPRKLAPGTVSAVSGPPHVPTCASATVIGVFSIATERVNAGTCRRTMVTEENPKSVELLDHECERRSGRGVTRNNLLKKAVCFDGVFFP